MAKIGIIGGGAAGFFGALRMAELNPEHEIFILEKTRKLLSKVRVSGGGRCNVTHACFELRELSKKYPRGAKFLYKAFKAFMPQDMMAWLNARGLELKTEEDGRIFPQSDSSQSVIDCFLHEAQRAGIKILLGHGVEKVRPHTSGQIQVEGANFGTLIFDKVLIATGGSPKRNSLEWLEKLGHRIQDPVPSLFTFNFPEDEIRSIPGIAVTRAKVKLSSSKLESEGPVLVTHWGLSGPAVLRLSAWGARELADRGYQGPVQVNWLGKGHEDQQRQILHAYKQDHPSQKIKNYPSPLPKRLWDFLVKKAGLKPEAIWQETLKSDINRLGQILSNDQFQLEGKTTFKEEFVTCGGIDLRDVQPESMESKVVPGLFFAGEILDIDGITGGFNFQAAWSSANLVAQALADTSGV